MALRMADLPIHDRPRERLMALGVAALNERELLAILLRDGVRGANAIDLAGTLLNGHGGLTAIATARLEELAAHSGVGLAKASAVVAAFELGRRVRASDEATPLRNVEDIALIAQSHLRELRRERVVVLVCDAGHRVHQVVTVSEGTTDKSLVPVREILNAVLRHDGRAFALAHNHPSGDAEPSQSDVRATREVREAARVTGLRFLGHVVVSRDKWTEVR